MFQTKYVNLNVLNMLKTSKTLIEHTSCACNMMVKNAIEIKTEITINIYASSRI